MEPRRGLHKHRPEACDAPQYRNADERHPLLEYVRYYHLDGTHLSLDKDTPDRKPATQSARNSKVVSFPRLGGLHHRYDLAA